MDFIGGYMARQLPTRYTSQGREEAFRVGGLTWVVRRTGIRVPWFYLQTDAGALPLSPINIMPKLVFKSNTEYQLCPLGCQPVLHRTSDVGSRHREGELSVSLVVIGLADVQRQIVS